MGIQGFGLLRETEITYEHVQGGNVPGGHNVIRDTKKEKPFITPTKEFDSIKLRYSDRVVDIGAYVGTYAIRCARFPVESVYAFEPTPRTFEILKLTHLPNMMLSNNAVVGDDSKTVEIAISRGTGVTNSIVQRNKKIRTVEVPAVSYSDVIKQARATIVKIDVEGAEYDYPIVQPGVRAYIIDFHAVVGLDWKKKANEIITELKDNGFKTIVEPNFEHGWLRAGSWQRPLKTEGGFEPMLGGEMCCGCGIRVNGKKRSLCPECWDVWLPKHRKGYRKAEKV
jgi:FkbM family methyltransferase